MNTLSGTLSYRWTKEKLLNHSTHHMRSTFAMSTYNVRTGLLQKKVNFLKLYWLNDASLRSSFVYRVVSITALPVKILPEIQKIVKSSCLTSQLPLLYSVWLPCLRLKSTAEPLPTFNQWQGNRRATLWVPACRIWPCPVGPCKKSPF